MFPDENKTSCENGITISKRQASILVALFLFLALTVFIIGYFLGKKSMLDSLTNNFEQEIEQFDQFSPNNMREVARKTAQFGQIMKEDFDKVDASGSMREFAFDDSQQQEVAEKPVVAEALPVEPAAKLAFEEKVSEAPIKAYAQLIGFGSKQTATAFKNRLAKKKIEVKIKTRTSKTAKGRKRTWYQAVTPVFTSFEELEKTIKKIQKLEYIRTKDINIVHIKEQED